MQSGATVICGESYARVGRAQRPHLFVILQDVSFSVGLVIRSFDVPFWKCEVENFKSGAAN